VGAAAFAAAGKWRWHIPAMLLILRWIQQGTAATAKSDLTCGRRLLQHFGVAELGVSAPVTPTFAMIGESLPEMILGL
jgi:hypothetical protein